MTEEQLRSKNPWMEVANMYKPEISDCLYGENKYFCEGDSVAIENYNLNAKGTTDEIITKIPAEPWWGNPLTARLIILSLNPGYVPEINEKLAKLLQSNDKVREQLINYKAKTLRLEAEALLPKDNQGNPISCKDAVNMLGDWYWYKKLKQLKEDVGIDEDAFFEKIALVEYHGYSSETSYRTFPVKKTKSHEFLVDMIKFISKRNVIFLIMRSVQLWDKLLASIECDKRQIFHRKAKSISQYITPGNLEKGDYKKIVKFLRYGE